MKWFDLKENLSAMHYKTKVAIYIIIACFLSAFVYGLYTDYKNNLISQQEQHMLSISQSISRSIKLYIDEMMNSMAIVSSNPEFEEAFENYLKTGTTTSVNTSLRTFKQAEGQPIYGTYLFDASGKLLLPISSTVGITSQLKKEAHLALNQKGSWVGKVHMDPSRHSFILNVYEPILREGTPIGIFCVALDLQVIYDKLIAPIKIGTKGYALVKDEEGIIIMHQLKEQIGYDVIDTRKMLYPNLDFSELERLIDKQLEGKEGTMIFHSYWWAEKNDLRKAKKISAFTPVTLGDHFWVVGLTMSYDEIQRPMTKFLVGIIAIAVFIALLFHIAMQALSTAKLTRDELEQETIYLKMLNESSEQLRQQEAELYHSQKLKMIGTLTGGIAHDINNLLTPIYGYSEMMLIQTDDQHPLRDEIEEIYKASSKGKDLIEQLLSFSRKGSDDTASDWLNLTEVTKETLKLLRNVLPKNARLYAHLPEEPLYIHANYTQLHQVIFNLGTNAFHALKKGEGHIEVSLFQKQGFEIQPLPPSFDPQATYACLQIKDDGSGMNAETLSRIFEPFFTTKSMGEGTGLGLYVVKSIVEKHFGHIDVHSQPDEGSTFLVTLPTYASKSLVSTDSDTSDILAQSAPTTHMNNTSHTKAIRVLAVDDNATVLRFISKGLSRMGFEVDTYTSSAQALKHFKENPHAYDVILTDYMMPEYKGTELAKKIKKIRKDIGIVLMTGFMDEGKPTHSTFRIVDAYLLKPIEIAKLAESLYTITSRYVTV